MEQLFGGGILWTLLIGFVCGLLVRAIKPGRDKLGIIMARMGTPTISQSVAVCVGIVGVPVRYCSYH
jgi:uncharacterized membrane protein YeaQ/YmgE (transglycosylase-associated protein family)